MVTFASKRYNKVHCDPNIKRKQLICLDDKYGNRQTNQKIEMNIDLTVIFTSCFTKYSLMSISLINARTQEFQTSNLKFMHYFNVFNLLIYLYVFLVFTFMHNLYAFVFTVQVFRFFLIPVLCIDNNVDFIIHISVYKSCFIGNLFQTARQTNTLFYSITKCKSIFKIQHIYNSSNIMK